MVFGVNQVRWEPSGEGGKKLESLRLQALRDRAEWVTAWLDYAVDTEMGFWSTYPIESGRILILLCKFNF